MIAPARTEYAPHNPTKVVARARRLLPDRTVHTIPNAGHSVLFQYPGEATTRIIQFIEANRNHRATPS